MKLTRSWLILAALLSASLLLPTLTLLAQTPAIRARVTQPVDIHALVTLHGNVHPLARPEFDQGVAPDDLPMERILLVLQRSADQEASLRQLLDSQQVKSSPLFHQWLTPEQFGQQFGPADSDVQAVTEWLLSQGFQVTKVAAGRTVIEFSGTAGLVRQVLGTEIHKFRVNGEDHWANTGDPQIPAALAPVVAGFASLNNFPRTPMYHSLGTFSRSKSTGEVQPLFTFPVPCGGSTCYYFGLGPWDFATIYNVSPLWSAGTDGTGQTIAIVGQTNINPQDAADFRTMFGLPANPPNIILNGPDPGITEDEPEADLDVQWSGAVAKGATIDFVVSESTETTAGIDLSALYIIDNNLAPVMSESYGACEAYLGTGGNQFYNTLWEQAAAQGVTVLLAAGDSGSAGCDSANGGETYAQYGLAVSGLASTPFNVAVGGTDFNINSSNAQTYWSLTNNSSQASAKSYIPEITWNDSCADSGLQGCNPVPNSTYLSDGYYLLAGGGGPSSCTTSSGVFPDSYSCSGSNSRPSWQTGTNVPSGTARDIPDISMFAGDGFHYSFYITCQMDANPSDGGSSTSCDLNSPYTDFQGGAGTSAAAQVFAGIMAMVNQAHGRQGNANYVLYPMAAAANSAGTYCNSSALPTNSANCIFYDLTGGNNSVICEGGSPNCSSTASGKYGVMVSGGSPAYPTATGYDLATGLGSVNVANLVNNWKSNFTTSNTSLSLSTSPATNPITLTHGQPIDFTISVGPGTGGSTPSGDVSLIAQTGSSVSNVSGIGPFTLNDGTASGSTIMLPGGSYNVTAHYAGNGTYGASDSTPGIPVTVNPEASQTLLRFVTFNLNTGAPTYGVNTTSYGYPYVLRMDVTNSSGNLCAPTNSLGEQYSISYPCPTGTITVTPTPTDENPPAGTVPGSYKLNSQGYAEDEPIQLSPGTYPFVASYSGDNSYNPSTISSPLQVTITPGVTTTTLGSLPTSTLAGTFVSIGTTLATGFTTGVAPTGVIQFLNNGNSVASVPIGGLTLNTTTSEYSGQIILEIVLPVGVNTITAQYPGDTNYAGSASTASTIKVGDLTLSANPSTITIPAPGQAGTATISLTPQYGFSGPVTLTIDSGCPPEAVCTITSPVTLSGSAAVTSTLTVTTSGSSSVPPWMRIRTPPRYRFPAGFLWGLAGLLVLAVLYASAGTRRLAASLFAAALLVASMWLACGGGGGGSPAPTATPAVTLSSTSLTFASQNVGTTSAAQSVTLTNSGSASLSITNIGLTGTNSGDFSQTNTCSGSVTAGANCSISVTFKPTAAGTRSASVSITDNGSGSPQSISLSGTAVAQSTPAGTYSVLIDALSGGGLRSIAVNVVVQ